MVELCFVFFPMFGIAQVLQKENTVAAREIIRTTYFLRFWKDQMLTQAGVLRCVPLVNQRHCL